MTHSTDIFNHLTTPTLTLKHYMARLSTALTLWWHYHVHQPYSLCTSLGTNHALGIKHAPPLLPHTMPGL